MEWSQLQPSHKHILHHAAVLKIDQSFIFICPSNVMWRKWAHLWKSAHPLFSLNSSVKVYLNEHPTVLQDGIGPWEHELVWVCWNNRKHIMVSILPLISFMIDQIVGMKAAETSAFRRRHYGLIVKTKIWPRAAAVLWRLLQYHSTTCTYVAANHGCWVELGTLTNDTWVQTTNTGALLPTNALRESPSSVWWACKVCCPWELFATPL